MTVSRIVASAAVAMAAFTIVGAPSASAAVLTTQFRLAGTTLCLDGSTGGAIADVRLATCGLGDRQLWRWSTPGGDTSLRHVGTGACAHRVRTEVGLSTCGTAVSQRWKVTGTPDAMVIKAADTGQCLGRTAAARVGMSPCNGGAAQHWQRG